MNDAAAATNAKPESEEQKRAHDTTGHELITLDKATPEQMAAQLASRFPVYLLGVVTTEENDAGASKCCIAAKGPAGAIMQLAMNIITDLGN